MNARTAIALGAVLVALCACGGGSSMHSNTITPPTAPTSTPSSGPTSVKNTTFVITVPAPSAAQSASRRALAFAAETSSVVIAVDGATIATADVSATSTLCATANGQRVCNVPAAAPVGSDVFTITAFDQPNGGGTAIARGTVAATVAASGMTSVPVVVTGTIAKIVATMQNQYPPAGTAATSTISVQAFDPDGNTIIGAFTQPVALSNSDTSGTTVLASSTLTQSTGTATLSYTGKTPFVSTSVTATYPGIAPSTVVFAPSPTFANLYNVPEVNGSHVGIGDIARGADGNMWVLTDAYAEVLKISPSGVFTAYRLKQSSDAPEGIAAGSDGNMWFGESGNSAIGKITPAGVIKEYTVPNSGPDAVTLGKDGNIWFSDPCNGAVGKITPAGVATEYPLPPGGDGFGITSGSDGNLWISDCGNNTIDVVSTAGAIVAEYPIPTANVGVLGITTGPDGNVWFAEFNTNKIGRITPSGVVTEFSPPGGSSDPYELTPGPDGNVWVAETGDQNGQGKLAVVTPAGLVHEYISAQAYHTRSVAFDANGTLWYTSVVFGAYDEVGTLVY